MHPDTDRTFSGRHWQCELYTAFVATSAALCCGSMDRPPEAPVGVFEARSAAVPDTLRRTVPEHGQESPDLVTNHSRWLNAVLNRPNAQTFASRD